jgi:hypothetical protein
MKRHQGIHAVLAITLTVLLAGCWGTDKSTSLDLSGGGGVAATATAIGIDKCHNCHSASAEAGVRIFAAWENSVHGNPDNSPAASASACVGCHDPNGDSANLSKYVDAATVGSIPRDVIGCEACHGGGSMHLGVGPMAYPTPDAARCGQCHKSTVPSDHLTDHPNGAGGKGNPGIHEAYGTSKHALSVNSHIFDGTETTKVQAKCSKCHTDEGGREFAAIDCVTTLGDTTLYPPLAVYSDVQCRTCHKAHDATKLLEVATTGQSSQYNTCTNCHQSSNAYHDPATNAYGSVDEIITDTHFENTAKTAKAPITGYIIRKARDTACTDCHNPHSAELTENKQWKASGHGDFAADAWWDEATRYSGNAYAYDRCQRCHSATGFVKYSTNQNDNLVTADFTADGVNDSYSAQVLYCWACHQVSSTGFTVARRVVQDARIPGAWDNGTIVYSSTARLNSYTTVTGKGDSEICMNCHSGRPGRNGFFVRPYVLAQTGLVNIDNIAYGGPTPHYLDTVQDLFQDNTKGIGGYALPGKDYTNDSSFVHNTVGGSTSGPCVGCHMNFPNSTTDPTVGKHSFLPFTYDDPEARTAITAFPPMCASCHTFTVGDLNTLKARHGARLVEFRAALEDNSVRPGIFPNVNGNGFYTTAGLTTTVKDWQTRAAAINVITGGSLTGYDLLGIAWNFNQLNYSAAEPGAWAHNSKYAGRLIYDAIVALGGTPSTTNFPGGRP